MRVAVTGATGFLGSHTVAALLAAGHEVRLLVRSPAKVPKALAPFGVSVPEEHVLEGDVLDPDSVAAVLEGCDALIHAAAVYSLKLKDADEIVRVNVSSTVIALDAAIAAGLDPIVHVSSFVALLPGPGEPVGNDVSVGSPMGAYCLSKAESERVARARQDQGHPVVIVWPGMIIGPHDPYLGESNQLVMDWLAPDARTVSGCMPLNDVRDVAAVLAACIEPGKGPRRFLAVHESVWVRDLPALLREVLGRDIRLRIFPAWLARLTSRWLSIPPNEERVYIPQCRFQPDATGTTEDLGIRFRSKAESVRDTVDWLVEAGHLPDRSIGD